MDGVTTPNIEFNCVCNGLEAPLKYPNSVLLTDETDILPLTSDINAPFIVKLYDITDDMAPSAEPILLFSCVCIELVTPDRYPSSTSETLDTATLPLAF